MKWISPFGWMALGAQALMSFGCRYPNQFQNVGSNSPHAVLTAEAGATWRDRGPKVFTINAQPTSFWRSSERFQIPPGQVTLKVIADRFPYDFDPLTFMALDGRHYHIRYERERAAIALFDLTAGHPGTIVTNSARRLDKPPQGSPR
ncbi:MAG: hypothetical protein JNN07_09025 [Verrucomicrobiales bacterium]|nr:hypothetical protein [Verrucomicrobiales bacterium]